MFCFRRTADSLYRALTCAQPAAAADIADFVMQHLFADACRTALLFDMRFVFISEIFQGAQNRVGSGLSQAAKSCFLDILGKVFQQLDIALASLALRNPGKDFQHTLRAFAAGSTFAAGFRLRKVQEELGNVNHAGT